MHKSPYILEVSALRDKPKQIEWNATQKECKELAERLDVLDVEAFSVHVLAERDNLIRIKGQIKADIIQKCVVTGEPVEEKVEDCFEEFFTDDKRYSPSIDIDINTPDITPVENGRIDLQELSIQYLILFIDPYPHKNGVHFEDKIEEDKKSNPFAVLEKLKH